MPYYCNPVNISYRYQFHRTPEGAAVCRESADPSAVYFKGRYYIFASMTLGVWVSDDLVTWENRRLPEELPLYQYAPDACVIGEYLYICATQGGEKTYVFRTKDVLNGPYERLEGLCAGGDPHLFRDDDGRVYFYWGCTNWEPIWGVEVDADTMKPLGEKVPLIWEAPFKNGYERVGEDNCVTPRTENGERKNYPWIEGAWMTKYDGRYYLQYACPGTQYNTYADGVYVSDRPLGPFAQAENNPFSLAPGGFLPGAGHGSTLRDEQGRYWHIATQRISVNHMFERRVGIWPAGFDADGEMVCDQRYGDWPRSADAPLWQEPQWYLLSYNRKVTASSHAPGHGPALAAEEDVRTWWQAASAESGQWLEVDLGCAKQVHAVQVNFADDSIALPSPGAIREVGSRYIEERELPLRWVLEGSADGEHYTVIADRSAQAEDRPHDLMVWEEGLQLRYVKLTVLQVPYGLAPCVSGLRVFGLGSGEKPARPAFTAARTGDTDMAVICEAEGAVGFNILWGHRPDKLYHSYLTYAPRQAIGALVKGQDCYVRVDAFNECGITCGETVKLN